MPFRTFLGLFCPRNTQTIQRDHVFPAAINLESDIVTATNDSAEKPEFGFTEKRIINERGSGLDRPYVHSYRPLPWSAHQEPHGLQWPQINHHHKEIRVSDRCG